MKNKILILSYVFLVKENVEASQDFMRINHHPNPIGHFHNADSPNFSSQSLKQKTELSIITDPYELAEKSDEFSGEKNFQAAAELLVDSAIYGNEDNIAFLYDIDSDSIEDLSGKK